MAAAFQRPGSASPSLYTLCIKEKFRPEITGPAGKTAPSPTQKGWALEVAVWSNTTRSVTTQACIASRSKISANVLRLPAKLGNHICCGSVN